MRIERQTPPEWEPPTRLWRGLLFAFVLEVVCFAIIIAVIRACR